MADPPKVLFFENSIFRVGQRPSGGCGVDAVDVLHWLLQITTLTGRLMLYLLESTFRVFFCFCLVVFWN